MFGNLASTGATGHQLTTSWTIGAGIEHYWTPAFRTSAFGSYSATTYNGTATDAVLLVAAEPDPHAGWCCSDRRRGVRGLQPRLQRVERRYALDLEPGAEPRCRPRGDVHQARAEPRSGARSRSTSRVLAVVRSASTRRRDQDVWSPACSASSATSGHDRLITAHTIGTPGSPPGVPFWGFESVDTYQNPSAETSHSVTKAAMRAITSGSASRGA